MPQTPKKKRDAEKETEQDRSTWSEDQKEREYYYDDAHGYETYKPNEDEKEDSK